MGKLLSSLQLQTFLILWLIYIVNGAPYSKYGRSCKDIGCLPRETCVMAYDTCSFNQQEGTNCGRYPTCKMRQDMQTPQQNTNTGPSTSTSRPSQFDSIWNIPTTTTTQRTTTTLWVRPTTTTTWTRPTTTTTTTRRAWTTKSPFYNPNNPSYGAGGNYFGNRYGDDDFFGGSSSRTTTKRPSSSSSDSFGGFFSGLSSLLSGDVGKLISGALSNRGGSSSSGGGFFDTRPLVENKNYRGGLFSENPSSGSSINNPNAYPITRYGSENIPSAPQTTPPTASHGNYGWKLT